MVIKFASKADTLQLLNNRLAHANILPSLIFSVSDWKSNTEAIVADLTRFEPDAEHLFIRSSHRHEDGASSSQAGRYASLRSNRDGESLRAAVNFVVASYGDFHPADKVFAQRYLTQTIGSGVVFNRSPRTGAKYDVVNYTAKRDTSLVTSGSGPGVELYTSLPGEGNNHPSAIQKALAALRELEFLFGNVPLDVEFAILPDDMVILLQVRSLTGLGQSSLPAAAHARVLAEAEASIKSAISPQPRILGAKGMLGVMPDWNPAEMIGLRPRPLAVSLYRALITDTAWAESRYKYGYRDMRGHCLLFTIGGLPYIDVRSSFNSLVPATVPAGVAERFLDACLARLYQNPQLHDKVEFEVIPSCYTFRLAERLSCLKDLSSSDRSTVAEHLIALTQSFLSGEASSHLEKDAAAIAMLECSQQPNIGVYPSPVSELNAVFHDCRRYGTEPFAGLARSAFIATDLLRSMVARQLIEVAEFDAIMKSIASPASALVREFADVSQDPNGLARLIEIYGHLRPGTYDIRVPSYAAASDRYFRSGSVPSHAPTSGLELSAVSRRRVILALKNSGLQVSVEELLNFIKKSIFLRERAKFVFTKSVSRMLELVAQIGSSFGFSRDDLSFAEIRDLLDLHVEKVSPEEQLGVSISKGQKRAAATDLILLPPLLREAEEVRCFHVQGTLPNFVTRASVEGPVATPEKDGLDGCIVLTQSADPGYDWLFQHQIAGLVTAFGGSNSHMAVRAAEIGLPAVIGAGEAQLAVWSRAQRLRLDCGTQLVEVVA